MIALFEASAFSTLILLDSGYVELQQWMRDNEPRVCLSSFGWGEFVSAVSLRVRRALTTADRARKLIEDTTADMASWTRVELVPADIEHATELVARFELMLKLPDAIHLAVALRLGAWLITADRRQAAAAHALGLSVFNPLSGDPSA